MSYEDLADNKEQRVTATPLEEKPEAGSEGSNREARCADGLLN
jgi:hypothetical protein